MERKQSIDNYANDGGAEAAVVVFLPPSVGRLSRLSYAWFPIDRKGIVKSCDPSKF